jgi:uncharacterized membrane protein YebE (DUF533 family)
VATRQEPAEEIPAPLLFAIVRGMVAAALADGRMGAEEKALIQKRLGGSGLSDEQIHQIHRDLVLPPTPDELGALVSGEEERALLYRLAATVIVTDANASRLEKSWLVQLASALGLSEERRRSIEQEIFA